MRGGGPAKGNDPNQVYPRVDGGWRAVRVAARPQLDRVNMAVGCREWGRTLPGCRIR